MRRRCGQCRRPYTREDDAYQTYCLECRESAAAVLKRERDREAKDMEAAEELIAKTRAAAGLRTR